MAEIDKLASAVTTAANEYLGARKKLFSGPHPDEQHALLEGKLRTREQDLRDAVENLIVGPIIPK